MRILILNCHTRIGHAVAGSLARFGHEIVAAAMRVPTMLHGRAGVVGQVRYADPFVHEADFVEAIARAVHSFGIEAVFPVHEEVFVVALHRAAFEPAQVVAPSFAALLSAQDKLETFFRATALSIPTPRTRLLRGPSLQEAVDQLGMPLIVKPRFGSGASGVIRVRETRDIALAEARLRREGSGALIAQSMVGSAGAGVGALVWRGRLAAIAGHKRLREVPISGGSSTARISHDSQPLLVCAERMLLSCALDGAAMVEFRIDDSTGEYWLLEVNPRYWGGLPTGIAAGVDFPAIHLACANGLVPADVARSIRTVESRWILGEIRAAFEYVRCGRLGEVRRMFRVTRGARLTLDDFAGNGATFAYQALAYFSNLRRYGSFGGHSRQKNEFFERHAVASAAP